jgi:hypothetical protein
MEQPGESDLDNSRSFLNQIGGAPAPQVRNREDEESVRQSNPRISQQFSPDAHRQGVDVPFIQSNNPLEEVKDS